MLFLYFLAGQGDEELFQLKGFVCSQEFPKACAMPMIPPLYTLCVGISERDSLTTRSDLPTSDIYVSFQKSNRSLIGIIYIYIHIIYIYTYAYRCVYVLILSMYVYVSFLFIEKIFSLKEKWKPTTFPRKVPWWTAPGSSSPQEIRWLKAIAKWGTSSIQLFAWCTCSSIYLYMFFRIFVTSTYVLRQFLTSKYVILSPRWVPMVFNCSWFHDKTPKRPRWVRPRDQSQRAHRPAAFCIDIIVVLDDQRCWESPYISASFAIAQRWNPSMVMESSQQWLVLWELWVNCHGFCPDPWGTNGTTATGCIRWLSSTWVQASIPVLDVSHLGRATSVASRWAIPCCSPRFSPTSHEHTTADFPPTDGSEAGNYICIYIYNITLRWWIRVMNIHKSERFWCEQKGFMK